MAKSGGGDTPADANRNKAQPPDDAQQTPDAAPRDAATLSFIRGVIERGEAGHYDADGKLPLPYKYAIIGIHPDGLPIIKRVRM